MMESTEIAQDLGYLDIPPGLIIKPGQMRDYSPEQLMILISGTQGEPMSALSRAAVDNHKHARIDAGDTVVLSSRIIPGNEKSIFRVIDHLYRRDANVICDDGSNGLIHVSGHGSQEEKRLLINLVRPKFFVPVHGDYRYLRHHAQSRHGNRRGRARHRHRRRRRARTGQERRPQEGQGHRRAACSSTPARRSMWSKTWSFATAAFCRKTASCWRCWPSTSAPARWSSRRRW